jgi:hypothetical protein
MSPFFPRKGRFVFGLALLASFALVSFAGAQDGRESPEGKEPNWLLLFTSAGTARAGAPPAAPRASRFRAVTINSALTEPGVAAVGDRLYISPFDDVAVLGTVDRIGTDVNGVVAVRARIAGSDGYLIMSSDGGRSLGRLVLPGGREYEFSCPADEVVHTVREFAPGARVALDDGPPLVPPAAPDAGPPLPPLTSADPEAVVNRIDCMIVYTPSARNYANSISTINTFVSQAMQLAQLGMDNSQVEITMRLAYSALVDYAESGASGTDLNRLTSTSDGYMDEVHTWRNTEGADVVHLFTYVNDTGGLGWLLNTASGSPGYAFCIGRVQQVSWTTTTVHEWGHNMGCHHRKDQPVQPGPGLYSFSAGWRWIGSDGKKYCSIMSYQDDYGGSAPTQVPYFSNPSILYQGAPTGHAADGDNARTLRVIKAVISAYRAEKGTNTLVIAAGAGGTTSPAPGAYTYPTDSTQRITAVPATHYRFLSWSGDVTGSQNPVDIKMDRDKSIAASFQRIIYPPSNAAADGVLNRSLSQAEYINVISFAANPNNVNIQNYNIYLVEGAQKTLVVKLDANTFLYLHRMTDGDKSYTYHIVAVNNELREGDPAIVSVR